MSISSNKYLSGEEIKELKESLALASVRDQALVGLLMSLGMRGAEVLAIPVKDVNITEGVIYVPGKKRSNGRLCPIPSHLVAVVERHLLERKNTEMLFDLSASGLKLVWNRLRPCKKGVHSLRHTFAIELYKKTRDIKLVQVCLGHKSILSTQVYADFVYSTEEIRKALIGEVYCG